MALAFAPADPARPPASELIAAMVADIGALYGPLNEGWLASAPPEELAPPGGICLVGREDGAPVCVGGLKRLGDDLAEIKRMYVTPAARGRGFARQLLAALEDEARRLGYARLRLDTGPRQPYARALYESVGYREIPDYNGNVYASFWAERAL